MSDIFNRVSEALSPKVEVFETNGIWSVRVTDEGFTQLFPFSEKELAVKFAEEQRVKLGLAKIIYL